MLILGEINTAVLKLAMESVNLRFSSDSWTCLEQTSRLRPLCHHRGAIIHTPVINESSRTALECALPYTTTTTTTTTLFVPNIIQF